MTATLDYHDILAIRVPRTVVEPVPAFTSPVAICSEYLSLDVAIMSTTGQVEPSHACQECDEPLWVAWSYDNMPYAPCPYCGEEATPISYCRTCDGPNCRNRGH